MVLKILSAILIICITQSSNIDGPLFVKYKSEINKRVTKNLDIDKSALQYLPLTSSSNKIEAYELATEENKIAYLYIKEVQACSLNGCSAAQLKKQNIASEYYDIAVLTDSSKKIISINILDYFSDYGYEISSKRYLKKYKNLYLCDFSDQNKQVDGISGATISYNALIASLSEFCSI